MDTAKVIEFNKPEKWFKPSKEIMAKIEKLIDSGIALRMVRFKEVIRTVTGENETALYDESKTPPDSNPPRKSRQARMWFTPNALIIEQEGRYKILPPSVMVDNFIL